MSEVDNLTGKIKVLEVIMHAAWRYGGMPIFLPRNFSSFETILLSIFLDKIM